MYSELPTSTINLSWVGKDFVKKHTQGCTHIDMVYLYEPAFWDAFSWILV